MKNITYINAGAGSGKTYRLTSEMVDKVKKGLCSPSQIIASTFTNAAADDLKKNAREKFLREGLIAQAAELDSAAIGTVHSIGLLYIKKYWYKLGLSASVETITDASKKDYLNRTMTKVVTDDDFSAFMEYAEAFNIKKATTNKFNYGFWKTLVQDLVDKADTFGINDLSLSREKSLQLAHLLMDPNGSFSFLNNTKKSEDELRSIYYDCIQRIFRIASDWQRLFDNFKEEYGLIEFNDMENKFITLLQDNEVCAEISRTIKYVFVDEFQDSNPKQIKIFDLLSDLVERSFWVGDPKQAIYGFRGCDTLLVQALTDRIIQDKNNGVNGMDYDTLKLSRRSVKPLVDTTSAVFVPVFDDINPDMVRLEAYRTEPLPNGTPALWHWEQMKTLEDGKQRPSVNKEKLFRSIARQVRAMVDGNGDITQVIDQHSGQPRPVTLSDIAILARTNEDVTNITNALKAKDIPVVCESKVDSNSKELRLVRLLLNFMIDESPLLKAEIAHLLYGMSAEEVLKGNDLPDFCRLDAMKERLKILPVADMVKSIVIELDLMNRCQQWGKAAQRQRNLQAVIEDAKNFDTTAETLGEASTVEHYLDHLDDENGGVVVKKGFFQEGVHVMNYHNSKGLQWHIVILCSLDNDELIENSLLRRFAIGVNYVRVSDPSALQLYSDYYLTCLPPFLAASNSKLPDAMAAAIRTLTPYVHYVDRVSYELRRLLYVGVTRARDYLVTTSLEGKKLSWLINCGITPQLNGTGDFRAVWGDIPGAELSRFVRVNDDGTYQSLPEPSSYLHRKDNPLSSEPEGKCLSPSRMEDPALQDEVQPRVIYPVQDETPQRIHCGTGDEYDIMGTCIHNIYAIYRPEADRTQMLRRAQRIIDAYGMGRMLPDADSILRSVAALYGFLERRYGKAFKIAHEVPFRHQLDGQVVVGEIDLLWYTSPKECVLIDFKNYPGVVANVLSKDKPEYVGKYAVQLAAYERALHAAVITVRDRLIYYSVLGHLIAM